MYGVMTISGRGLLNAEPHEWQRLYVDEVQEGLRRRFGDQGAAVLAAW